MVIAHGDFDQSVACPTAGFCVAVAPEAPGCAEDFVSFDPTAPGRPASVAESSVSACPNPRYGVVRAVIACPSEATCAAVTIGGDEVTLDPSAPGPPTTVALDPGHALVGVACVSSTECAAVDADGGELTFDPAAP